MKVFFSIIIVLIFNTILLAQVPRTISYQGILTDNNGNPLPDGSITIDLKLYNNIDDVLPIYNESHNTKIEKGVFNVVIGSVVPLPNNLKFDRAYFIGVGLDGGIEMKPRTIFTSVPYAISAQRAELADDLSPNASGVVTNINGLQGKVFIKGGNNVLINSSVDSIIISATTSGGGPGDGIKGIQSLDGSIEIKNSTGPITDMKIQQNRVNSGHITNGSIEFEDLSSDLKSKLLIIGEVAGGDLVGNYPNPNIRDNAINKNKIQNNAIFTEHITNGTIKAEDIEIGVIPDINNLIKKTDNADGDITGTFSNLQIKNSSIGTNEIQDGSIQQIDIAPGIIPTTLPPSGIASGDLRGNYPNPIVQNIQGKPISTANPSQNQVLKWDGEKWSPGTDISSSSSGGVSTTSRFNGDGTASNPLDLSSQGAANGQVLKYNGINWVPGNDNGTSYLAGAGINISPSNQIINTGDVNPNDDLLQTTSFTFDDSDLSGIFSNLQIKNGVIGTSEIANNSIQAIDIAPGVIPNTSNFLQNGSVAGGSLVGTYPNPNLANNSVGTAQISEASIQLNDLAAEVKIAGGDLTGNLPNPSIGVGKVNSSKILDGTILPVDISTNGVSKNNGIFYNGSNWVFGNPVNFLNGTGITASLLDNPAIPMTFALSVADQSPTNEIQTLSFNSSNKQLSISSGNTVDLSSLSGGSNPWTTSGNNIFNANSGNVGIGTSTPTEKLEINGEVLVTGGSTSGNLNAALRSIPTNSSVIPIFANTTNAEASIVGINDATSGLKYGIAGAGLVGVYGGTNSSLSQSSGVLGISSAKSPGVKGQSTTDTGVEGIGTNGVSGFGTNIGIFGQSDSGVGISGICTNGANDAIKGTSNGSGVAIHGINTGSGFAGLFDGKIKATGGIYLGSAESFTDGGTNTILSNSHLVPTLNNARDLGSSSLKWRDVWCSRNAFNGSDIKMKRDIKPLSLGLNTILQLNSYSYKWKEADMDDNYYHYGIIAQELYEVLPDLVRKGNDKDQLLSVNYIGLIPILINAVKDLKAENEALKKEIFSSIEMLKANIEKINETNENLKSLNSNKN